MNALVASVIRTIIPVVVGQVASWLLLLNIVLPKDAEAGLSAFLGGLLTAIYYVAVRILEQQWPSFGILLGLTASPDTYSKSTEAAAVPAAPTVNPAPVADILAPVADASIPAPAPAVSFSDIQAKIDAVLAPAPAVEPAPAAVPATPAQ